MRTACLTLVAAILCLASSASLAQEGKRYDVTVDAKTYPQASPRDALASVLKAIDAKKFEYLVAQLAEPTFVDDRVKRVYAGKFAEQVADTQARLDAATIKQLKKFAIDGKWTVEKTSAVVQLDDVKDRVVRLVKLDGRWYLSHRYEPPARD